MPKKKILYHSNYSKIFSGFGKNAKNILSYLQKTGKYDLVELSNGVVKGNPELSKLPWRAVGGVPNDQESINRINKDPNIQKTAQYGFLAIDNIIKSEKPDIYLGVEDIWGISPLTKKPWWNKINCIVWSTLDSLPILPDAVNCADKIKNYYVWASFAEKAMKETHGQKHVKTLHGAVDTKSFYNLGEDYKQKLRNNFKIDKDAFVIGFVFRNQLRKSVPNLLEGFKLFKKEHPNSKAKLLLHTNFSEGWNIHSLMQEKGIDPKDVLCTYFCNKCKQYEIKPFQGQNLNCPYCGSEKSQNTVNIASAVSEEQLNEIYNMMDVYCHPFTSGGQEIPIQEAKLTELITLVTNYSCGEDSCGEGTGGLSLDWSEYREPGTQFIKASTDPKSILKNLKKVFKMDLLKRSSMGKKARNYVIENYSIEVIGKKLESIIDSLPEVDYDYNFELEKRNPNYLPPNIESDSDWLIDLYKNMIKIDLDSNDEGHKYWMKLLSEGSSRDQVLNHFRQVAIQENQKIESEKVVDFKTIIGSDSSKKALFSVNKNKEDVFLALTLLKSFKENHPNHKVYFATDINNHSMVASNPYIDSVIPYQSEMDEETIMIGAGMKDKYFDVCYTFNNISKNYISIENKDFPLK